MTSTSTLGPNQPHIQLVPETLPPKVRRQMREADHSPPFSAEVKNGGNLPLLLIRPYFTLFFSIA
jgi:hypothetical protein